MSTEIDVNTINAIADIVHDAQVVKGAYSIPSLKPRPFVITPKDHVIQLIDPAPLPTMPVGHAVFQTAESFAHYVNQFKQPETAIAFDDGSHMFRAVFDYHTATGGKVGYGNRLHSCAFALAKSDAWVFWTRLHDQWLSQEKIVELFEERAGEVTEPTIAELLKVAVDFKSTSAEEYTTRYDRVTQRTELVAKLEANQRGGDSVAPPASITISVPVFKNGVPFAMTALLSWKGKPDQFVKLRFLNMTDTLDGAIEDARKFIAAATGIPVLRGILAAP
jgi:hypothetical protein